MLYFLQIMNKSLNQEVFVTLLQPQNSSIIYTLFLTIKKMIVHYTLMWFSWRNPHAFIYLKPEKKKKKKTFRAEAMEPPHIGHYREYPPPPSPGSNRLLTELK